MINCSPTKLHKILQKIQLFTPVSSNFHPFHPHFHPPPRTSIRGAAWGYTAIYQWCDARSPQAC